MTPINRDLFTDTEMIMMMMVMMIASKRRRHIYTVEKKL